MKILEIDSVPYGSTCKISVGISRVAAEENIKVFTASGYSSHSLKELPIDHMAIGGKFNKAIHLCFSVCTGLEGYLSIVATKKLIKTIQTLEIDLIHFHNLHGNYLNFPMLFKYIKDHDIPVIWTMHDCWAVTGLCPHFTMIRCDKWKDGCHHCQQYRDIFRGYLVDNSKFMWKKKKKWFTGINNLTIVTPSNWLANIIRESYLGGYDLKIINNGIDLNIFRPTASNFGVKHHCQDKNILLGVSGSWGRRKGLDVFIELACKLDSKFQIVLVGTNAAIDQQLPSNIISIHRTQNQTELAEIYTAADIFINPTREENFPTVNLEALACGTPVVTFNTGGSPECFDETCGAVVPCDDVEALIAKIEMIIRSNSLATGDCISYAQRFNMYDRFQEYVELYKTIIGGQRRK